MNTRRIGYEMEERARLFLEENGLQLIARNYQKREGEIDLIMKEGDTLVFVEVKYRKDTRFGHPFDAIDVRKQATIRKLAGRFLSEHKAYVRYTKRFDYIGILGDKIEWINDAF